jgi:periplasmic divalent cation tolerance protein
VSSEEGAVRIFYVTLNTEEEARAIAARLFERRDAVCCNWFPVNCAYLEDAKVHEGPEIALLIKTIAGKKANIEAAVAEVVNYVNFIGEINLIGVNSAFAAWLGAVVKS